MLKGEIPAKGAEKFVPLSDPLRRLGRKQLPLSDHIYFTQQDFSAFTVDGLV